MKEFKNKHLYLKSIIYSFGKKKNNVDFILKLITKVYIF